MPKLIGSLPIVKNGRKLIKSKGKFFGASVVFCLFATAMFLLILCCFSAYTGASAQAVSSGGRVVVVADFSVQIDPGSVAFMSRVVSTAQSQMPLP